MVHAADFHGMVDVLDDFFPAHFRKFAGGFKLVSKLVTRADQTVFILAALRFDSFLARLHLGGDGLGGIRGFLAEKAYVIIDLHDPAVFGQGANHVVGHIARHVAQRAAGGVRSDHRSTGDGQRVIKSLVGHVGDIHHHAQAVHFANHVFAEGCQPIVRRLIGGRVGPLVVYAMGQGHVAHAQRSEGAQHAQVAGDHVTAFHAHERGNFALRFSAVNVGDGGGQDQIFGVQANGFSHGVNLIERALHRFGAGDRPGYPNRKEHAVQSALAHARDIELALRVALADVPFS